MFIFLLLLGVHIQALPGDGKVWIRWMQAKLHKNLKFEVAQDICQHIKSVGKRGATC